MDRISAGYLYVKVGDKIHRQEIGVSMGTSCSPFLANLNLFMFEFKWFSEQNSRLRPWHLQRREQLMNLTFCTRYIMEPTGGGNDIQSSGSANVSGMAANWGTGSQGAGERLLGHEYQT